MKLSDEVEAMARDAGKKVALVDGYKNARMVEKLGLPSLPAMVELASGKTVRWRPLPTPRPPGHS